MVAPSLAHADEIEDVLRASDDLTRGNSSHSVIEMSVHTASYDRMMRMEAWSQGTERTLIRILYPEKDAGISTLKVERKATPHYVKIQDLPEPDRFRKLATASKHFIDTIKIVAYRAECAMTNIVREVMPKPDQARALIAILHATEADIQPNYANKTLTVRLHRSARAHTDAVIAKLCDELSATETVFPQTELRMIFKLGSA